MNDTDSKKLEETEQEWWETQEWGLDQSKTTPKHFGFSMTQKTVNRVVWLIAKVKEQDREIDYQYRRRKWALHECRTWQRHFCFYKDDAVRFHSDRADKAETRIKELEQELLWTADACEKAESLLTEKEKGK